MPKDAVVNLPGLCVCLFSKHPWKYTAVETKASIPTQVAYTEMTSACYCPNNKYRVCFQSK